MIQKPRGTNDWYGTKMRAFNEIKNVLLECSNIYGFQEIKTPVFESTDLFLRNIGEGTDIVNKEMYTFVDKSNRSMTLRPELTAPAIRLYLENKLYGERLPVQKLSYLSSCYRYERPGVGRYREFHQFGVELIGSAAIQSDLEIINLGYLVLETLNLNDDIYLKINTIGKTASREKYKIAVREYFNNYQDQLCNDCQNRLETNPLRILDCKKDSGKSFYKNAPLIYDYLTEEELTDFEKIKKSLNQSDREIEISPSLVRGLDYYNDIVFEFVDKTTNLTVIAGGRYDGLIGKLHKEEIPAVGFGLGIERLIELVIEKNPEYLESLNQEIDVFYIGLTTDAKDLVLNSMTKLRAMGIRCETDFQEHSLKSQFKMAEHLNAVYAVIIGEEELKNNTVTLKNLVTRNQEIISLSDFESAIAKGELK